MGIFYKNSLPGIVRNDLSFDESIVIELKLGRKCAYDHNSPNLPSCLILEIYIPKLKLKICLQYFLLEILIPTLNFGGLMEIQP